MSRIRKGAVPFSLAMISLCVPILSGCSQTLSVDPGPFGENPYCLNLIAKIPVELGGELIRTTDAGTEGVAAWGDPAIVMRCGVIQPPSLEATSQLFTINGIDWLPEELTSGQRFTSMNTPSFVEVNIPEAYDPASGVLVDLATALATN